jgi:hypothetical protein
VTAQRPFRIELPVRPGWSAAEALRGAVEACLRSAVDEAEERAALSLVAGELIEGAVANGAWDAPSAAGGGFALVMSGDGERVRISIERPVRDGDPGVERLLADVRRLAESDSAEQAYVDRLRLLVAGASREEALALARVAHEGGCRVSAEVGTDGVLRVVAVRAAARAS